LAQTMYLQQVGNWGYIFLATDRVVVIHDVIFEQNDFIMPMQLLTCATKLNNSVLITDIYDSARSFSSWTCS